jgi:hypothetical protein
MFDLVEEPFDLTAGAVELGLKHIGLRRLIFLVMLAQPPFFISSSLIQPA